MSSPTPKCYVCKMKVSASFRPYGWVVFLGRERPHCSVACKEITLAKKTALKGSQS